MLKISSGSLLLVHFRTSIQTLDRSVVIILQVVLNQKLDFTDGGLRKWAFKVGASRLMIL